ncbi:MAG: hypothetical protein L0211_11075 [Planctomycetaceae bacterium]|nr:hypothetical protein [Planctomycetaceae bacterium]
MSERAAAGGSVLCALVGFCCSSVVDLFLLHLLLPEEEASDKRDQPPKKENVMDDWPGRWAKMLRPERCGSFSGVLLGRFLEVPLHWTDGLTPCWGDDCPLCPAAKRQFRYYAPASFLQTELGTGFVERKPGIVELYDEHMQIFAGKTVRGVKFKVCKSGKGKLWIAELSRVPEQLASSLEPDFDVAPFLERLFGRSLTAPKKAAEQPEEQADVLPFHRRQA